MLVDLVKRATDLVEEAGDRVSELLGSDLVLGLLDRVRAVAPAIATQPDALAESFTDPDNSRNQLLGVGIISLTFAAAGIMAWRLPMKRNLPFGH